MRGLYNGASAEPFSSSNWDSKNPTLLVYKTESRPAPPGETCDGSCTGFVMTEAFSAFRTGNTDIRFWDALEESVPAAADPRCAALRDSVKDWVRDQVFPFGVGRGSPALPGARGSTLVDLTLDSVWQMPGYPGEALSDSDLSRIRRVVAATVERIHRGGAACAGGLDP